MRPLICKVNFSLILLFSSIQTNAQVKQLLVLPVISNISLIEKGNKGIWDSAMTVAARDELSAQLKKIIPDSIKLVPLPTDKITSAIEAMAKIVKPIENKLTNSKWVTIPEELFNIMEQEGQDYAIGIVHQGFVRTEENMSRQYTNFSMIGFYDLGLFRIVPYESRSAMVCFIVDRKSRKIKFYKRRDWVNRDPSDKLVIRSELYDLLMSYFQKQH